LALSRIGDLDLFLYREAPRSYVREAEVSDAQRHFAEKTQ
jgi:hypothetical protein